MPITIGSNIAALRTQRQLARTSNELASVYERLSSGQRINKASDDAAGLSIASQLNSDRRVFNQGIRNFNDGISLLNIADGAIENLSGIVIRLKELAEQSANGTYSNVQRAAIDKEAQALSKEYTRIAQSTKFNGRNLFDGGFGELRLQGGFGLNGGIQSGLGGAIGTGTFSAGYSDILEDYSYSSIVTGDLNGDGILDMVRAGFSAAVSGGVASVSIGKGDGTFYDVRDYLMETISYSSDITLGDLNGDGILDMVTSGMSGVNGYSTVRLGAGDGTFGTARSYQIDSTGGSEVNLGDLNQDGILDLVTASNGNGRVTIRLGAGDGTFGSSATIQAEPSSAGALVLGDLNRDGNLDIITGGFSAGSRMTVMLGNGNGTFSTGVSSSMPANPFAMELADLNNDGILDLVSSNAPGSQVAVKIGAGDGTFSSATTYQMGTLQAYALSLGDLNGDGHLDLVTAGAAGGLFTRMGNGNGTFGAVITYQTQDLFDATYGVATGDVNGDGILDIITAGSYDGGFGTSSVFIGSTKSGISSLLPFNLGTLSGARQALPVFDQKIQQLGKQRGQIGAFQSRVQVGINNLQSASENYAAAESRIKDADIAAEAAQLIRLNILQQAASSILGQANQQPALALKLLGGV